MKQIHWQSQITEVFVFNLFKTKWGGGVSLNVSEATAIMTAGHREEREASEMNKKYHGGRDSHG